MTALRAGGMRVRESVQSGRRGWALRAWNGAAGVLFAATAALAAAPADELTPVRAFRIFNKQTAPELPESIVTDLLQDAQGQLWIATLGGLATYDGTTLRAVADPLAPRGGWVLLVPRERGGVYAASRRGVHVYDGRGWRRLATPEPVESLQEVRAGVVRAVFGGRLWQSPSDAAADWQPVALPPEAGEPIAIFSDRRGGQFVIGKARYLRCRDADCQLLPTPDAGIARTNAITVTAAGVLWAATWDGHLQFLAVGAERWTPVDLGRWPSGGIRCLTEDRRGRVWAGGMARLCHGSGADDWQCWSPANGLPESAALTLLADREGTLWIGTNGAGLLQWVGESWSHLTHWPGSPGAGGGLEVTGMAATHDGGFVASVFGKGILGWDRRKLTAWGAAEGLDEDVRSVAEPEPGVVWAAARHGVFERRGSGGFRKTLPLARGFANGFARSPQGDWYTWTEQSGIYRYRGSWQPEPELNALVPGQGVISLFFTRAGTLWIGSETSLVVRHPDGRVDRHPLGLEHGLPDSAGTLVETASGQVWVGGLGGMALVSPGARKLLREADGVPGNVYFLREAVDGALWVGGSRGISRYRGGRFTTDDTRSGLLSAECNRGALAFSDGTLLAATSGSLARFDAAVPALEAPPLLLGWSDPQALDPAGALRLPPERRRLTLGWSAPWLAPQPVEYRTRIGIADAWSQPTRISQLVVDNLSPGTHTVAVEARLAGADDAAWSAPLTLRVEAAAWWWETPAARAALVLGVAGLALLGARFHARRLHARRAAALVLARNDFIASASHELRTPIALIRLFVDTLRLGRTRDAAEHVAALDTIHRATLRLEALAGNLLQLARGQSGAPAWVPQWACVDDLVAAAVADQAPSAQAHRASIERLVDPALHAHLDVEGTRQVLANLLDNALKYGPPGQTVRVGAEARDEGLRLWVADQGPGIPRAARTQVWQRFARLDRDRNSSRSGTGIGLAVVREMAERAGGRAWIEDAVPAGACVCVLLPQPEFDPAVAEPGMALGGAPR